MRLGWENNNNALQSRSDITNSSPAVCNTSETWDEDVSRSLEIFDFSRPLPEKNDGVLRLFYNNCNGIAINQTIGSYLQQKKEKKMYNYLRDTEVPTKLDGIVRQLKLWEVDIAGLSEFCVAWEEKVPRRIVQQITQNYDQRACWTVASSNMKVGSFCKPGGTGILTMADCNGRVQARGTDPWKMGRWSYIVITGGKRQASLLIVTGYRTGQRSGLAGHKTAWAQQQAVLWKDNRTEKPHEAFMQDLTQWISTFRTLSMEVIVMLDANEKWGDRAAITKFADDLELRNVNQEMNLRDTHPNISKVENSTTIDYCLCSNNILEHITYAASVPYDLETLGDHRGFILDLNISQLWVEEHTDKAHVRRKLFMSNPKAVGKYLSIVEENFTKQNIFKRSLKLIRRVNQGHTDYTGIMKQYDKLDAEVFGICQRAEKKCMSAWAGKYEWSPALARAIKTIAYWRQRLKQGTETLVIKQMGRLLQIEYQQLSKTTIHQLLNESKANLRKIQQTAREHRKHHLEDLARQYATQHNVAPQRAVIELLAHEESRESFRTLRWYLKPNGYSSLSQLWVAQNEEGKFVKDHETKSVYTNKDQIHQLLLDRNVTHLNQASNTPFATGRFRKQLKWDGTGPLSESILTGDILNTRKYTRAMQLYLESLRMNDLSGLNIIKPTLLLDEYQSFWKKKRENTVTSPFGLHVGHYKAATLNLKILEVHRRLLLLPFQTGLVPKRWRRTVQTMLEKEPGEPWIHRLRIIELFDAQANAGFQLFVGRKMMRHAVSNSLLSEESFGSTPGKMATSAVIQKTLAMDQLRIERRAGGLFDCDASGCYDRILPPLASVHLQALGLHRSVGTFLARLMYLAKRHVRTGCGVSRQNIGTTKQKILHGIGQGNGGGPAMWISHLTVMFKALSAVCLGVVMTCIQNIKLVTSVGTGYVDDVTLGLSIPRNLEQTESNVYRRIKLMSQLWEKLLHITGGRLELSKCFWIPVTWKWKKGKPLMVLKHKRAKELVLTESETHESILIPRKTGNSVEKRLGVYSSCDGRWTGEYKNWISFSAKFGQVVKKSNLGRISGYLAYHSMWLAKFRYSAPVIGFSHAHLERIQKSIIGPCLSVAGYCSKTPRAVVYGPATFGGMGWKHIKVVTLFEKLKFLIGSIRLQDTVGRMLEIQLDWIQLFAGTGCHFMRSKRTIPYLPKGWISNLHGQMVQNNIFIDLYEGWIPHSQRVDDRIIMDIVMENIPSWAWEGINNCRLFLQATTIADLTTEDGKYIPITVRKVQQPLRDQRLTFPVQHRPDREARGYWKYFIDFISQHGHLHTPVGQWVRFPDQIHQYMYDHTEELVYKFNGSRWQTFGRKGSNSRRFRRLNLTVHKPSPHSRPVQVIDGATYIVVLNILRENPDSTQVCSSLEMDKQQRLEAQILGQIQWNEQQISALEGQWHSPELTLICATDGGLKNDVGTSSYAFFFPHDEEPVVMGATGEYQPLVSASSTRQELLGQVGAAYVLHKLQLRWGIPRNYLRLILITDSQASIDIMNNVPNITGIKDTLRPEMDIALELQRLRSQQWWVSLETIKVESHIDISQAPDEFYWGCNNTADWLATVARDKLSADTLRTRVPVVLEGTKISCMINGRHVNNDMYKQIDEQMMGETLKQFLLYKHGWTEKEFMQISWEAHEREINKYPLTQRVTLTKYIHGWLATKKRRYRNGELMDACCPLCGLIETKYHFLNCNSEQFANLRSVRWQIFLRAVAEITQNGCRHVIKEGLATLQGHPPPTSATRDGWHAGLQEAYREQDAIGWDQFLLGRLSRQWEQHATTMGSDSERNTGYTWTGKVIRLAWRYGLDVWQMRNQLVHGSDGLVSRLESGRTQALIVAMYRELRPVAQPQWTVLNALEEQEMLRQPHQTQVAWLEQLRYFFEDKYDDIARAAAGNGLLYGEFDTSVFHRQCLSRQ